MGAERVLEFNLAVTEGLLPDKTFVLNVDPVTARAFGRARPSARRRRVSCGRCGYRQLSSLSPIASYSTVPQPGDRKTCRDNPRHLASNRAKRLLRQRSPKDCTRIASQRTSRQRFARAFGRSCSGRAPCTPISTSSEALGEMIRIDAILLHHDLHMRPFEADRRVYLIYDARLLNDDAADALSDLEEPPPYAVTSLSPTTSAIQRRFVRAAR